MPSNHHILCCPLLLLPPIPPSNRVFSNESTLRMVGWRYRLNRHEFGWTPGVGDRQGGLACCDSCKNTGVGCHFLLQCMKVKSERDVAQSCPTLSDPIDCSLPGSSVHGIFQTRVLEWVAMLSSRGTSQPRATPSFPSQPEGKIGLPRANPRGRLTTPGLPVHHQLPELTQTHVH